MINQVEGANVWYDSWRYEEAMSKYQVYKITGAFGSPDTKEAPEQTSAPAAAGDSCLAAKVQALTLENSDLKKVTKDLQSAVKKLEQRIAALETAGKSSAPAAAPAQEEEEDDDDIDLFGSDDEEDEEAERVKEERLKAYAAKKSKKPTVIAKSNVIFDVKPWDDETDMKEVEKLVREIKMDGLLWGTSKLAPVAFEIKKLVIACVIEDDKVSTQDIEDIITGYEDFVQSVDIAAFNKI